ncbi:dTDP-4-dehydrorhamnose 3,5-epimerase [Achromobacter sp. Marseille-Q0513]|uniref:dTDP-4-dehydrorhamnose 3,5-epimerase n=1 Tax=Achromobacter sp. Marseille-Q0513 TaxID=2829161 RepID=UPI001B94489C|nr:dTDP-4-dehydrorhamnose 3,5-epimerase [Achromobacter sp. Marseille-Q0513]MBR8655643.1 dTDP-4-dehydrorhamnose 3,5-epimerase [Achromobacter sp. Marseille-Q0513]
MQATRLAIPDIVLFEPRVFGDDRGFFMESFNQHVFQQLTRLDTTFVQDNHSKSARGVLRGLHYQLAPKAQGKLVRVVRGAVFDVAVDIRKSSPSFGQWVGTELSETNRRQLWIPPGFAHGFLVLSESAEFLYKTTEYYAPDLERCIIWNDPRLAIDWPAGMDPQLSAKDQQAPSFAAAEYFP